MAKHGKIYRDALEKIDREHEYAPAEAVALVKEIPKKKFDESVELHVRTGLNVRHADEQLRGTIALPHGLGKDVTVAVFAKGDAAREAQEAGADHVGADDLAKKVEEGFTDFDVAIATPDMMPVVGKLGRILGPQGKMPNPKVGTVDHRRAQGRRGVEGGQGRVPHGPHRDRPPGHRQGRLRRAQAAGELRRGRGGADPGQARRPPRAATCARSPCPRRWAPGSRSTRRGRATSSRRKRRPRRPRRLNTSICPRPPAGRQPRSPGQVEREPTESIVVSTPACVRAFRNSRAISDFPMRAKRA